ncbi:hypothetical protein ASD31_11655 [Rhizobium sp. Root482]|nr:hypothetical protein ASD31_11655 [Rhizobium sp. Root482]
MKGHRTERAGILFGQGECDARSAPPLSSSSGATRGTRATPTSIAWGVDSEVEPEDDPRGGVRKDERQANCMAEGEMGRMTREGGREREREREREPRMKKPGIGRRKDRGVTEDRKQFRAELEGTKADAAVTSEGGAASGNARAIKVTAARSGRFPATNTSEPLA